MNDYNEILKLLNKKYKHIKNIKNTRSFNIKIIEKRLGIKVNNKDKYYFYRYIKDICHLKNPKCGKCFLLEFCNDLGDKYSYHRKLKCKRCGHCCTLLLNLTDKDVKRIKKAGYKEKEFIEEHIGRKYMKLIDHKCFFLRKKNKYYCEIYEYRPNICRIYPSYDKEIKECKEQSRLRILHKLS